MEDTVKCGLLSREINIKACVLEILTQIIQRTRGLNPGHVGDLVFCFTFCFAFGD